MNNLLTTILMMALSGQLGGGNTVQTPKTESLIGSIKSAGDKNGTSADDIEDQLSIFDNQLAIYEPLAAIPMFAQYLSPMMNQIKEKKSNLELVLDHFEAFDGDGDGVIDKYDRIDIEEAAEADDNAADFSEEDLDALYDMHGLDYDPEEDFVYSEMNFDDRINYDGDDNVIDFDDDDEYSDKNILVRDRGGDDTYTITEEVEDANFVFTKVDEDDAINLEGEWSSEQIEDAETGDDFVVYTNEDTGTKVYVKGTEAEVEDIVSVEEPTTEGTEGTEVTVPSDDEPMPEGDKSAETIRRVNVIMEACQGPFVDSNDYIGQINTKSLNEILADIKIESEIGAATTIVDDSAAFSLIDTDNSGGLSDTEITAALARNDLSYEFIESMQMLTDDSDLFDRADIASGGGVLDKHIARHDFRSLIRKLEAEKAA